MLGLLSVILIHSAPLNQLAQGPTVQPSQPQNGIQSQPQPSSPSQGQSQSSQPQGQSSKKQQQLTPLFLPGGQTIEVNGFNFIGNKQVPTEELEELVSPYVQQPIAQSDLNVIKGRIKSYYTSQGLTSPQVVIPTQADPSILDIVINESNTGANSN